MAPVESNKAQEDDLSFLFEKLFDQSSLKNAALERAAKINHLVDSVTLGPNSSFRINEASPVSVERETPKVSFAIKPKPSIQMNNKPSMITPEDLRALQQKFEQRDENKKLQEKVQKQLENRALKEEENYQKIQVALEEMKLEAERKTKERADALKRHIEEALKIEEQEELAYQKQRADLMMNSRKILEQQEKELRENLKRLDDHFGKLENAFNKIVQSCNPGMSQIIEIYKRQMEDIKQQKNSASLSLDGMKRACINVEELCHALMSAIKDFESQLLARKAQKEADERLAQKEAEKIQELAKAEAEKRIAQAQSVSLQSQTEVRQQAQAHPGLSETSRYYNQLMQFLNEKQNATKLLSEAQELQSLRFALKVAVNSPINVLNEQNRSSLVEGFQMLHNLLAGQRVETAKGVISVNDHPQANDWTNLRLAEKLIDVCDKKPDTVFYVAALIVALWQKFPEFGQIFIAKLYKECPFFVPFKPPRLSGQSDEDFLQSWGYRSTNDQHEKYALYQARTSKFAALFAAVWVTHSRRNENAPNPFGIDNGWKYLVNTLNSPPDSMYLHLLDKILETAGATLHQTFGKQFVKLMFALRDNYLPALEHTVDIDMKAAFDRLRNITMAKFFKESRFEHPKGKMAPNYW